jgi:hypothetical protein
MIILIHGNDLAASRNFYFEEKNKTENPVLLNGDGLTHDLLFQSAENTSLFDDKKTILVENFFSKNKTNSIEFKKIIDYINSNKTLSIIFWEPTELSKTNQTILKSAIVRTFSFPQILFTFLDNIKPNNSETLIKVFNQLKTTMEPELIFFMLTRQFRLMLNSLDSDKQIDELKRMAPWQLSKLKNQTALFDKNILVEHYNKLFEVEVNQKTGKIPYNLEKSIDFFLAGL